MEKKIIGLILASVIGIVLLYYILNFYENRKVDIADLKEFMGESIKIEGIIKSVFVSKGGTAFLKVSDVSGDIDVVVFKNSRIDIRRLERGDKISVIGEVAEYKGKLEVIAKEISQT